MKIKTTPLSYEKVIKLPGIRHTAPKKPDRFFGWLVHTLSESELRDTDFTYTMDDKARTVLERPCLILMNHSSFIDLKIASKILYPRQYSIICTSDGFVGKKRIMEKIGCIPTQKFVTDISLIRDMKEMLINLQTSVLMYPEASYSFDGCPTPLPRDMGGLVRLLGVPVIMIKTEGAFSHDPLYNCLRKRKVKVSAHVSCVFDESDVKALSSKVMSAKLDEVFTFDNFRWQTENKVRIIEPFRAEGLERILYKCCECGTEGKMESGGAEVCCRHCGKRYTLNEFGVLEAGDGEARFPHIPDWYRWERECVREEIKNGTYILDTEADIGMMVDYKSIYMVGKGRLVHDINGFALTGCDGKLNYRQSPKSSYSLYSDYYWYEIGDMICIGSREALYYCFPEKNGVVAKTRMAAEELYRISMEKCRSAF